MGGGGGAKNNLYQTRDSKIKFKKDRPKRSKYFEKKWLKIIRSHIKVSLNFKIWWSKLS